MDKAASLLFGWSDAALRGNNVAVLMPAEMAARHYGYKQTYFETGEKRIIEMAVMLKGCTQMERSYPCIIRLDARILTARQYLSRFCMT